MTKLSPQQRADIYVRYHRGDHNVYTIAKEYGVSRGTIYFIIDPVKAEKNRAATRERTKRLKEMRKK